MNTPSWFLDFDQVHTPWVSALAAEALGERGESADEAVPALTRSLGHLNPQVRGDSRTPTRASVCSRPARCSPPTRATPRLVPFWWQPWATRPCASAKRRWPWPSPSAQTAPCFLKTARNAPRWKTRRNCRALWPGSPNASGTKRGRPRSRPATDQRIFRALRLGTRIALYKQASSRAFSIRG